MFILKFIHNKKIVSIISVLFLSFALIGFTGCSQGTNDNSVNNNTNSKFVELQADDTNTVASGNISTKSSTVNNANNIVNNRKVTTVANETNSQSTTDTVNLTNNKTDSTSDVITSNPYSQANNKSSTTARIHTTSTVNANKVGNEVWVSATGHKYHRTNHCGNMNPATAHKITLAQAQSEGLQPCKKCYR